MTDKEKIFKIGTDQKHLKNESYKTAEKLDVRILTHEKYTHPKVDYYNWMLDQLEWQGDELTFDIGCGSGKYGEFVSPRVKRYIACDLSHGMLKDGAGINYECVTLDAMGIPLADNTADIILANHMIYHIPDQEKGIAEFRRVLKPGGRMLAATNAAKTMQELKDLRIAAIEAIGLEMAPEVQGFSLPFTLEEGASVLEKSFEHVEARTLENWLIFPEPQPVIDYIASSRDWYDKLFPDGFVWEEYEAALHQILDDHFASHSEFRVGKMTGAFVCW